MRCDARCAGGVPGGYGSMVGVGLEQTGYGMDFIGSDWDQTGDDACLATLRGLAAVRVMLFCMLFVSYRCDEWGMDSALVLPWWGGSGSGSGSA